jgi:hypothetical protein
MRLQARPVLNYLNDMYPSDVSADVLMERETLGRAVSIGLEDIPRVESTFSYSRPRHRNGEEQSIQFRRPKSQIATIRAYLGDRAMSAGKIGEHCFDYFLEEVVE